MSSAVAVAVKKIAVYVLGDENKRGKLFVAVGSIIAGFLGLMFLPIAVISSIGSMNIEQPDIDKSLFTESALFESLDSEQQAEITDIQNQGQAIEDAMTNWFCQYHLTHFIRTRIMQRERYDHSRAFFELPEAAHRWRCRFFC